MLRSKEKWFFTAWISRSNKSYADKQATDGQTDNIIPCTGTRGNIHVRMAFRHVVSSQYYFQLRTELELNFYTCRLNYGDLTWCTCWCLLAVCHSRTWYSKIYVHALCTRHMHAWSKYWAYNKCHHRLPIVYHLLETSRLQVHACGYWVCVLTMSS